MFKLVQEIGIVVQKKVNGLWFAAAFTNYFVF